MAARGSDLPGVITAQMMEQLMLGYADAFDEESDKVAQRRRHHKNDDAEGGENVRGRRLQESALPTPSHAYPWENVSGPLR